MDRFKKQARDRRQTSDQDVSTTTASLTARRDNGRIPTTRRVDPAPASSDDLNALRKADPDAAWLLDELTSLGLDSLKLKVSRGAKQWSVRYGERRLQSRPPLTVERVAARDTALVESMVAIRTRCPCTIVRPTIDELDDKKALDAAWADLRDLLHPASRAAARAATVAVQELALEDRARTTGASKDETSLATLAYRVVGAELAAIGVPLSGAVQSCIGQLATSRYGVWKKDPLGEWQPSFKAGSIPLRWDSWKIRRDGNRVVVSFSLRGGEWRDVVVHPDSPSQYAEARRMLSGEVKATDALLVYRAKKKAWVFLLGVQKPRNRVKEGGIVAVRRGYLTPLFALSSTGRTLAVDGGAYAAAKMAVSAQRASIQRGRNNGRKRREVLSGKERRLTKETIRQWWARVVRFAKEQGATVLAIEDFGVPVDEEFLALQPPNLAWALRRFPWGELKSWAEWLCAREGLRFQETDAAGRSHICPVCGDESPENHRVKERMMVCTNAKCGKEQGLKEPREMDVELAGAWNQIKRAGLQDDKAILSMQSGVQDQIRKMRERQAAE